MNTFFKRELILILLSQILFITFLSAQIEEMEVDEKRHSELNTLIKGKVHHGVYLGLHVYGGPMEKSPTLLIGGDLAWIANRSLAIGFTASALYSEHTPNLPDYSEDFFVTGGYGGLLLKPILFPKLPVHLTLPVRIGGGAMVIGDPDQVDYDLDNIDPIFVLEPGLEIEFNLLKRLRIGVGARYRYTSDIKFDDFEKDILRNWSAGVSIMAGRF